MFINTWWVLQGYCSNHLIYARSANEDLQDSEENVSYVTIMTAYFVGPCGPFNIDSTLLNASERYCHVNNIVPDAAVWRRAPSSSSQQQHDLIVLHKCTSCKAGCDPLPSANRHTFGAFGLAHPPLNTNDSESPFLATLLPYVLGSSSLQRPLLRSCLFPMDPCAAIPFPTGT